jgi:hypothetical protein
MTAYLPLVLKFIAALQNPGEKGATAKSGFS